MRTLLSIMMACQEVCGRSLAGGTGIKRLMTSQVTMTSHPL